MGYTVGVRPTRKHASDKPNDAAIVPQRHYKKNPETKRGVSLTTRFPQRLYLMHDPHRNSRGSSKDLPRLNRGRSWPRQVSTVEWTVACVNGMELHRRTPSENQPG